MALTNSGFNGTVTEADFAFMSRIGMAEGVESSGAWAVTQGTGRQTSTAAQNGRAFSCGVVSKDGSTAITTNLGTPTNGQWYLIVRRINWSTDTVTVVAIAHTTTTTTVPTGPPAGLPTMSTTPGTEWDQKLAWAWVRSTDTTMFLVDLRNQPLETRLDNLQYIPGLLAGPGRGPGAVYTVANPTALDAISNAVVGDTAWMTTPGTGINPFMWVAAAGSGATIDWRPEETVTAATKANLDSFISTVAAITDTVFAVGALATVTATGITYRFTSTAGALAAVPGTIIPSAATNGTLAADGSVSSTAQSLVRVRDAFPAGFTVFKITFDVVTSAASGVLLRVASGASDVSTGTYDSQSVRGINATADAVQSLAGTSANLAPIGIAGARHFGEVIVTDANVAGPTFIVGQSVSTPASAMTTSAGTSAVAALHRTTTAYDSFTLTVGTGTITVNRMTVQGVS